MKSNYNSENVNSVPAGACYNYVYCGNITPGGNENDGEMCNECLDDVRDNGRGHEMTEQVDREDIEVNYNEY